RGLARTFQIPRPFRKLSILDNVAVAAHYGARERSSERAARERAHEVLTLVGLPTDPDASPTLLGAGGLKKLELARALATRPALLLAAASPARPGAAAGAEIGGRCRARRTCCAGCGASSASRSCGWSTSCRRSCAWSTAWSCWTTARRSPRASPPRSPRTRESSRRTSARRSC